MIRAQAEYLLYARALRGAEELDDLPPQVFVVVKHVAEFVVLEKKLDVVQ